jgi:predicted RND superfamily exporter protein
MIRKLNQALTAEIILVAAFIGLAFRSLLVMIVSVLPGIFPIVVSGALLWTMGEGLQFASVVALTVSFGLGLSATIHYLNRLRIEDKPHEDPGVGVTRATVLVGPALILTSVVLACGLAVTVFSDLPSLRLFGWLSAFGDDRGAGRRPAHSAGNRDVPRKRMPWGNASAWYLLE